MRYGTKYEATKNLSDTEIAKLVRKDIAAAVKAGALPAAKYSVRTRLSTTSAAIDVKLLGELPFRSVELGRPAGTWWHVAETAEARALRQALEAIVDAYNFDGSRLEEDYFNVRFYGSVTNSTDSREREAHEVMADPRYGKQAA